MLGKEEYVKFVLGSVCHERAKFFIVDKVLKNHVNIFNKISAIKGTAKERSAAFIKSSGWYLDFISKSNIAPDFLTMYRFAAFVSKNIEKDGFIGKKLDNKLLKEAKNTKGKSYSTGHTSEAVGDYYLQQIFVDAMTEMIEKTF